MITTGGGLSKWGLTQCRGDAFLICRLAITHYNISITVEFRSPIRRGSSFICFETICAESWKEDNFTEFKSNRGSTDPWTTSWSQITDCSSKSFFFLYIYVPTYKIITLNYPTVACNVSLVLRRLPYNRTECRTLYIYIHLCYECLVFISNDDDLPSD